MPTVYHFGQALRWSWPWNSPNCLGAFFAMLFPVIWMLEQAAGRGKRYWVGVAVEAILAFGLCMTYSRGALLALVSAALLFIIYGKLFTFGMRKRLRAVLVRGLVMALLIGATGFFSRLRPGYLADDRSVTHRMSLWVGALRMIHSSPVHGWGFNQGALHYVNWFQPLAETTTFGNMVSGTLDAAVEFGLPLFTVAACLSFCCLLAPWGLRFRTKTPIAPGISDSLAWCEASAGVVVAFLVANSCSTLAGHWTLDVLPVMGLLFCASQIWWRARENIVHLAIVSALAASGLAASFWTAGYCVDQRSDLRVIRWDRSTVLLSRRETTAPVSLVAIAPDPQVLGWPFGKAIRELVLAADPKYQFIVDDAPGSPMSAAGDLKIWCGATIGQCSVSKARISIFLHPILCESTPAPPPCSVLVLPEIDQLGQNERWTKNAVTDSRLLRSPGVGLDIRSAWPDVGIQALIEASHE